MPTNHRLHRPRRRPAKPPPPPPSLGAAPQGRTTALGCGGPTGGGEGARWGDEVMDQQVGRLGPTLGSGGPEE